MKKNLIPPQYILPIASAFVFLLLLAVGFNLAQRKPIWNDEILTQTQAVDQLSYGQLMLGIIKGEGNNHPLFYVLQKALCDSLGYQFPKPWEGEYLWAHPPSQFVMRILPNIFMSLSLTILFYYFCRRYAFQTGVLALGVALLSPMIWIYWAEARPYSLWFLLSVVQSVLLLSLKKNSFQSRLYKGLCVVHVLLALTTMASALQIIIAAVFIFLFYRRPWREYLVLCALPLAVCFFYYLQSTKFMLAMPASWGKLLAPHLALDQAVFFIVYIAFLLMYRQRMKKPFSVFLQKEPGRVYFVYLLLIIAATVGYFAAQGFVHIEDPHNRIKDKYFLYMTPAVIMATVLCVIEFLKYARKDRWVLANVILLLAGFLVVRFFNMYQEVLSANLILNYLGEYW